MCSFKSIYFVIVILSLYGTDGQISDKRLCANDDCTELVSLAKTLLRYSSPDPLLLSCQPSQDVKVFSKEAGSLTTLWGVEIEGKRGYIPKEFVREYKILTKPKILVDTEISNLSKSVEIKPEEKIESQKVQDSFEVIDGTTVYTGSESISPSTTQSPVLSTAVPSIGKQDYIETLTEPLEEYPNQPPQYTEHAEKNIVNNIISSASSLSGDAADSDNEFVEEEEEEEDDDDEEEEEQSKDEEEQSNNPAATNSQEVKVEEINQVQPEFIVKTKEVISQPSSQPIEQSNNPAATNSQEGKVEEINQVQPEFNVKIEEVISQPSSPPIENSDHFKNKLEEYKQGNQTPQGLAKENRQIRENALQPLENAQNDPKSKTEVNEQGNYKPPSSPTDGLKVDEVKKEVNEEKIPQTEESNKTPLPEVSLPESPKENEANKIVETNIEEAKSMFTTSSETFSSEADKIESTTQASTETVSQISSAEKIKSEEPVVFSETNKLQEEIKHEDAAPNLETTTAESLADEEMLYWNQAGITLDPFSEEIIEEDKEPELEASTLSPFRLGLFGSPQPEEVQKIEQSTKDEEFHVNREQEINTEEQKVENVEAHKIEETVNQEVKYEEITKKVAEENAQEGKGILANILSFFESLNSKDKPKVDNSFVDAAADIADNSFVDAAADMPISDIKTAQEPNINAWLNDRQEKSPEKFSESSEAKLHEGTIIVNLREKPGEENNFFDDIILSFSSDVFLYLVTTAVSVIIFLFGYVTIDKSKREGPLVARINKLEQQLLIATKENELLEENKVEIPQTVEVVNTEEVEELTQKLAEMHLAKTALEEQVAALEKELDTSTEVGMELNRIVSEMLNSTNGSDTLKASVEQMQRQLLKQQDTIANTTETLHLKEMENHELHLELEISNKKVLDLQVEVDKMAEEVLRIEEERDQQQSALEREILTLEQKFMDVVGRDEALNNEMQTLRTQFLEAQREAELKSKEYKALKESLKDVKAIGKNNDALKMLLNVSEIKAQLEQLKTDNKKFAEELQLESQAKSKIEKQYEVALKEVSSFKEKYEMADKEKVEINTKLEVLNNYFKEKEAQLQKDISKYESMWKTKEGEAVSTIEQIRYMEERLGIYKQQNDSLKEEIVNQEVELKSQISMLEKKVHENWVTNRQLERKLEDARQEAAQLRNKLTMREMGSLSDSNAQNRLLSPGLQNGDRPLTPHLDTSSPPPLFAGRMTTSPPLPGLPPPPFLPPPPGVPFMPPPPFVPRPPPAMFPGDRRPPPLGRMSSPPPPMGRFTPNSEYSYGGARSPSPPGYGSESDYAYGRREYGRSQRMNGRGKDSTSGSDPLNDSLVDKKNRKPSNMV